jgi:hypothetical protein
LLPSPANARSDERAFCFGCARSAPELSCHVAQPATAPRLQEQLPLGRKTGSSTVFIIKSIGFSQANMAIVEQAIRFRPSEHTQIIRKISMRKTDSSHENKRYPTPLFISLFLVYFDSLAVIQII